MKLYIVVGRINGMVGFVKQNDSYNASTPPALYTIMDGGWTLKAFKDAAHAIDMHESMIHSQAKLCKVVEIEIPDEE